MVTLLEANICFKYAKNKITHASNRDSIRVHLDRHFDLSPIDRAEEVNELNENLQFSKNYLKTE